MLVLRCKTIVIGEPCVGKTALVQMFESGGNKYPKNYLMTNGVDFVLREVQIPTTTTTVELCIHDIGGQSIFAEQRGAYMKDASFFVLVYDVSNLESFHACSKWLAEVMALREEPIPGVLVANKIDVEDRIAVRTVQGEEFARQHGLKFFEASAAKGIDVDAPFHYVAMGFHELFKEKLAKLSTGF
eukprot:TRINITY_DN877_c0_g1_i5.p1 TRINITY_DN877_c0_g1~~TRINITY_DN877_c0_g1_i5.p1  ORF type:complete len:186 (+),score=46.94 TRINITY_DN877_c0_g1_i5:202-759(+)